MYFDPTQPWLAFIPTLDPADYMNSARRQSWIFPSNYNHRENVRESSRGGYTASTGILEHAPGWLSKIKRLADDLAQVHRWPFSLPAIPDTEMLELRLETLDEVQAHLWRFRRPVLNLLGFIYYLLSSHYLFNGRSIRDFPALRDEALFNIIRSHLFSNQDFRGVLIDTERFCDQYKTSPASCEPILQLLGLKLHSPIPLIIHHPSPYRSVPISRLNAVFSIPPLRSGLGKQHAYMMKDRASRSGVPIPNSKIAARARAHHNSVTLQSELDGVNLILFFFDEQPRSGRTPSSVCFDEEDMNEDDSDLLELEPSDFNYFQKVQHLSDALFFYDSGILLEGLLAQQPTVGNTPNVSNPHNSRPLGE